MSSRRAAFAALLTVAALTSAYTGNRDTYFAGMAGPYAVRVEIQAPGVIPGLARITVSPAIPSGIRRISVQPVVWNVPLQNAPAPDVAERGENGDFHAQLWLMVSGSYGVRIIVQGDRGEGTAIVPLSAVAYQRLEMPRPLALLLLGLAAFLAVGMITIVRAASRESVLSPEQAVGPRERRRGWRGLTAASIWMTVLVVGGRAWWNNVDRQYRQRLYRPPEIRASAIRQPNPILRIEVRDPNWAAVRKRRPLVPDEGKLAHIFLIGDSAFAHLHPFTADSTGFQAALPPLPPGTFRIFVEVTDSSGFTQTLSSTAELPVMAGRASTAPAEKPDGFWLVGQKQHDPIAITWQADRGLALAVRGPGNRPVAIDWASEEPADAVLLTSGGEIVHLRPHGTMSAAAMEHFTHMRPVQISRPLGEVVFPYPRAAPSGGRVWAQVRAEGKRLVLRLPELEQHDHQAR